MRRFRNQFLNDQFFITRNQLEPHDQYYRSIVIIVTLATTSHSTTVRPKLLYTQPLYTGNSFALISFHCRLAVKVMNKDGRPKCWTMAMES